MFLLSLRVENFCHFALLVLPRLDDTLRRKGLDKIKYCEASMNLPSAWQGAYQKLDWKYKGSTIFEEIQVVSYNFNGLYFYVLLFFMFL